MEELTVKDFLRRFDAGEEFDRDDLAQFRYDLAYDEDCLDSWVIDGEAGRWTQSMDTVVKVKDGDSERYFALSWEQGLTETCENDYPSQPVEVKPKMYTEILRLTRDVTEFRDVKTDNLCAIYSEASEEKTKVQ